MPIDRLETDAVRVAVLFVCTLAALPLLRRATSATRRLWLALALGGALVLPLVSTLLPAWRMPAPTAMTSLRAVVIPEPLIQANESTAVGAQIVSPARTPLPARAPGGVERASVLAAIWALGALLMLVRLGLGLARTRGILRRSVEASPWSGAVARASRVMQSRVGVRMTGELDAPAVTGVFAPVILVPRASVSWSEERRYAVLLHELAHVRQRDCLVHVPAGWPSARISPPGSGPSSRPTARGFL